MAEYLDESTYVDIQHGEEPFFGREEGYEETPVSDYEYQELWESFCNSVQHDTRFFNEHAIGILKGIFDGIKSGKLEDGRSPIYEIGRGTRIDSVFRARVVRSGADMLRFVNNPSKELGPPPKNIATTDRMNPAGVSVFYGALDEHTCTAELRLAVGESAVLGKFRIARNLRVLDFTRFKEFQGPVSMFDPSFSSVISQRKFLRRFRHEITRPIRPTDQEISYVPTQAVAEYLAKIHKPPIDALINPSAQTKEGRNIVIVSHAAVVRAPARHQDSNDELIEDEDSITVWKRSRRDETPQVDFREPPADPEDENIRPSLHLVRGSLKEFEAKSINYETYSRTIHVFKKNRRVKF